MEFFLALLLAVTVSGKFLDLSKVNVDDLPSEGQRPVFPGAPSAETESSDATEGTDDSSSCVDKDDCGSLVRGGFCNMEVISERIKKYHCPKSCNLCD
nr:Metridin ShK toxin domain containing protein [Haemonchus contortus]